MEGGELEDIISENKSVSRTEAAHDAEKPAVFLTLTFSFMSFRFNLVLQHKHFHVYICTFTNDKDFHTTRNSKVVNSEWMVISRDIIFSIPMNRGFLDTHNNVTKMNNLLAIKQSGSHGRFYLTLAMWE